MLILLAFEGSSHESLLRPAGRDAIDWWMEALTSHPSEIPVSAPNMGTLPDDIPRLDDVGLPALRALARLLGRQAARELMRSAVSTAQQDART